MNLINKKLKDKLKQLDDIDKQYLIKSQNKNKNNINSNIDSIEILRNLNNQHFDKIYSDFILNENSYYFHNESGGLNQKNNSINNNNIDKAPTNEDSIEKDKNYDILSNYEKEKGFQKQNGNKVEVEERLINYGIYLKNKIENQRKIQENKIKQLTQPKMYTRSHSNIRNPDKINQRLYENYNRNRRKGNTININRGSHQKNESNNDKSFSYHPKINKNSLLIAEKLEPSFIRLNKKKNKINNSKETEIKKYYKNLFGKKTKNDIHFFYNNFSSKKKTNIWLLFRFNYS